MRQETYDILNVGKHNRFFIRGAGGDPICVHNCGYGMSANTFKIRMELTGNHEAAGMSDTLVTAFRHKNYKIPVFWNRCNGVLEIMLAGGSIRFGGPNDDLFYADGSTEFFGVRIPTVQLPNGQYIFYQNLRKEVGDNGRMQFVYDQFKGSQSVPTRVWGSIIDENLCIAEDTLVLTDSGWKKIQDITTFDKVHDGIDFVTHGGLVSKSVKDCVKVDGVYMTKNHEVLTNDGWKTAEIYLSAGAASQLSRFDFSEVWQADCYQGNAFGRKEVVLGLPVREVQSKNFDSSVSSIAWDNHATTGGTTRPSKAVYDILNCGSRNRFVVKGDAAPFVVHNCQALSFVVLKWQAIEIAKRGVPISLNVHDEWVSVVPRSMAAYAVKVHHDCMKATPSYIPDGLLDCEVDVGINYADLHTIDVAKALGGK